MAKRTSLTSPDRPLIWGQRISTFALSNKRLRKQRQGLLTNRMFVRGIPQQFSPTGGRQRSGSAAAGPELRSGDRATPHASARGPSIPHVNITFLPMTNWSDAFTSTYRPRLHICRNFYRKQWRVTWRRPRSPRNRQTRKRQLSFGTHKSSCSKAWLRFQTRTFWDVTLQLTVAALNLLFSSLWHLLFELQNNL